MSYTQDYSFGIACQYLHSYQEKEILCLIVIGDLPSNLTFVTDKRWVYILNYIHFSLENYYHLLFIFISQIKNISTDYFSANHTETIHSFFMQIVRSGSHFGKIFLKKPAGTKCI